MSLDAFPSIEVDMAAAAAGAAAGADAMPPLLDVELQCRQNWCWAAVTVSLKRFFQCPEPLTQCDLAFEELTEAQQDVARGDCCDGRCGVEIGGPCSLEYELETPMRNAGLLRVPAEGQMKLEDLQSDLSSRCPVGIQIRWRTGASHAAAIVGFHSDGANGVLFDVSDPIHGRVSSDLEGLKTNYKNLGGHWAASLRTVR
jgi:hypothetical protein